MKKFVFLLFVSLLTNYINSQHIAVKSFRLLETDVDARQNFPERDQNGNLCAIIKVQTTETGFEFDNGTLGITKVVPKTAEIWVYVPFGTKKLSIAHPNLGMLRDYIINTNIQQGVCYEMILSTGKVTTIVEDEPSSQYFTIKTDPTGAIVFIDDEQQSKLTPYSKKMSLGKHTYRVELADYHNEAGVVELKAENKSEIAVTLKPAFGFASITTKPENGATVLIDNKPLKGETPLLTPQLTSGIHVIKIMKPLYKPAQETVTITDNNTSNVMFDMQPDFATVTIKTSPIANIIIDGINKGNDKWTGRLEPGPHSFEAVLESYRPDKTDRTLEAGQTVEISLSPQPRYGKLDINSDPIDASIEINGKTSINDKACGLTPNTFNKMLIGTYQITLGKLGYGLVTKTITITEGQITELNETLPKAKIITITTIPNGAMLYIDDKKAGITPHTGPLSFGSHLVKVNNEGVIAEKTIEVKQDGEGVWTFNVQKKTVKDIEENEYRIVTIDSQTWMAENLRTTKYNDGKSIQLIANNNEWANSTSPAYCWYDNDEKLYKHRYGALYNWFTVNTEKICPIGWHVPKVEEWEILIANLGGDKVAGSKLKEKGFDYWSEPNTGADNSTGFSAFPGGYRNFSGTFFSIGKVANWWSISNNSKSSAKNFGVTYNSQEINSGFLPNQIGYSIRCIKD